DNSNVVTQTIPNTTSATFTFDDADRLTKINHKKGTTSFLSLDTPRDDVGLVKSENTKLFGYDSLDRVKSQSASPAVSYEYDGADNLSKMLPTGGVTKTFGYDAAHQLTTATQSDGQNFGFVYDANGNRTAKNTSTGTPVASYGYDHANRLKGFGATNYVYNGDGLRTAKTGTGATTFVWDEAEGLPLLLVDGTTRYITGPGGLPLAQVTSSGTVSYYHVDQLGSTRALTDSTGNQVATYSYDPYGTPSATTGTLLNPLRFAGQYTDQESGLIYMRARYYDPATANFISRDPIESITRSPYAYVNGNPLNATDPSGLCGPFGDGPCPGAGLARKAGGLAVDVATEAVRASPVGVVLDVTSRVTGRTLGGCVGGSANAFIAVSGSLCYVSTPSGEAGFTGTLGYGLSSTPGASVMAGPTISNARSLDDLRGGFSYFEAFAGEGVGTNVAGSWGKNQCRDDIAQFTPSVALGIGILPGGIENRRRPQQHLGRRPSMVGISPSTRHPRSWIS
ncbi:MAG: RHS repeat-associated core domain-containing protein, partial [Nocardioidaceae bacterium]